LTIVVFHIKNVCLLVERVSIGLAQLCSLTLEFMQPLQLSSFHNETVLYTFFATSCLLNSRLSKASPIDVVHAIESSARSLQHL
jgi:hypothetical protein